MDDVIRELEKVIAMLRDSSDTCDDWVDEMERRLSTLRSPERPVQRREIAALLGRCHHQALGDALTKDMRSYILQVAELRKACERAIKSYDDFVA
jgi:hypothetical protein